MHKCSYPQLRALALFCIASVSTFGIAQETKPADNPPTAPTAAEQPAPSAPQPAVATAQNQRPAPEVQRNKIDFSKSRKSFPNMLAPYEGRTLHSPRLDNSPRINQLIKDGKLMLSLNDAIALALENNLDLAIARYNLDIADTDVLRTKAGAQALGVNTGVVQGTPGGGIGGFGSGAPGAGAGGSTAGAGGAGSGAGGLVQSTIGSGAPVRSYDPQINTQFNIEHAIFPIANQVTTGVPAQQLNTANANASFQEAFPTGSAINFGMQNTRETTNARFTDLMPLLNSGFRFTLTQR